MIDKAIAAAGGLQSLAATLDISYQAVQGWKKKGRIPSERVLEVERATGGTITRHDLRPDLYPEEAA